MEKYNQSILESQAASTKQAYERVKMNFTEFVNDLPISEEVVMSWLVEQAKTKAATTLWTETSHVFKYLEIERHIKIDRSRINKYLKIQQDKHIKKKAPAFTKEEIFRFLDETPNEPANLAIKLYVLFSYYASLRASEAHAITFSDVKLIPEGIMLHVIRRKTDKKGLGENILIPCSDSKLRCPVAILNLYSSLVPKMERFWIRYDQKSAKFVKAHIGKNTLAEIASVVAQKLGKENPEKFTGHSFRVTSNTVLADEGASITQMKRHSGWKSNSVAEEYIRESKKARVDTAALLSPASINSVVEVAPSQAPVHFSNCTFNNCKFSSGGK